MTKKIWNKLNLKWARLNTLNKRKTKRDFKLKKHKAKVILNLKSVTTPTLQIQELVEQKSSSIQDSMKSPNQLKQAKSKLLWKLKQKKNSQNLLKQRNKSNFCNHLFKNKLRKNKIRFNNQSNQNNNNKVSREKQQLQAWKEVIHLLKLKLQKEIFIVWALTLVSKKLLKDIISLWITLTSKHKVLKKSSSSVI